ncbi:alpha/beta hydrolase [Streptomyces sp. DT2A-34]|uniref:alpha/beta hydrolase n=1 Tax=Streptomyces sp. DT2A-34 TaxID=3051182 RepID=UPI00265BB2FA|nr:alpha/beta hydrolase [Streptomyces sp. DT2A-34]MDO0911134.1 alpha/beta hydrolase [Streptomyces sp. DT2A-34]
MDLKTLKAIKPSEYAEAAGGYRAVSDMADAARDRIDKQITAAMQKANEGEAADAALKQLKKLSENFHYAQVECGLVSGALNGFSSEIASPRRRLLEALEDAEALSYTVSTDGGVAYPAGGKNELTDDEIPGGTTTGNADRAVGRYTPGLGPDTSGLHSPNPHHAKAQYIADLIAHAVQEATEIDDRYSRALEKLKAAPGLSVSTKTWANVASDVDAVGSAASEYLRDSIPMDKSPADRKEWWDSLTQEQREEYLTVYPDVIGNLDGIPATVRDEANRENIQFLIGKLSGQDDEKSKTMLDGLKGIQEKLQDRSVPPMYLLGIGDEGNGRAIVSYGNPDTAKNVSAYVPGLETKLDAEFAGGTMKRAQDTAIGASEADPHSSTASIVWLGYDAPLLSPSDLAANTDVMFRDNAAAGAPAYNSFMAGISATNESPEPHITAIGHSYGSLTVGLAAQEKGGIPGADDIVLVGSPGTEAKTAEELNVGKGHVFVGAADNDIVTKLPNHNEASGMGSGAAGGGSAGLVLGLGMGGPLGALAGGVAGTVVGGTAGYMAQDQQTDPSQIWFGTDPANKAFGATRFLVDDGPTVTEGGFDAHSNYFNRTKDLMSADNIAHIVVGKPDGVVLEQPR